MEANTATIAREARLPFDTVPADAALADAAPATRPPSHRPVFVSRDGRRARVVRAVAAAVAAAMVLWVVALGVGLAGVGVMRGLPQVPVAPGSPTIGASAPDGRVTSRVDRRIPRSMAALVARRPSRARPTQSRHDAPLRTPSGGLGTGRPALRPPHDLSASSR